MSRTHLVKLSIIVALVFGYGSSVHARSCSTDAVTARGELARFEWLAKTKARANWRRKVRAIGQLGAPYAQWENADAATERCIKSEKNVYCIFTGIPCRN